MPDGPGLELIAREINGAGEGAVIETSHEHGSATLVVRAERVLEALRWLGTRKGDDELVKSGDAIDEAVKAVLAKGETLTYDLVGNDKAAKMSEVTSAIIDEMKFG